MLVFDVETRMLASEVAEKYAMALNGDSPWSRPDLFGFAVGVVEDLETGVVYWYGEGEAEQMVARLDTANTIISCGGGIFGLGVLGIPVDSDMAVTTARTKRAGFIRSCSLRWGSQTSAISTEIPRTGLGR